MHLDGTYRNAQLFGDFFVLPVVLVAEDKDLTALGGQLADGIIDLPAHLQPLDITHNVVGFRIVVFHSELGDLLHAVSMVADNRTVLDDIERPGIDGTIEECLDMALVINIVFMLPQFHEGFLYDILSLIVMDKACGIKGKRGIQVSE